MGRADPFFAYSFILRTIVYVLVPAFGALQFVRFKRALHVFQLEGYKPHRFVEWCRANGSRARFMQPAGGKKPLVMTGRAWRLLVVATFLSVAGNLVVPGLIHLAFGAPLDIISWGIMTAMLFLFLPRVLLIADVLLRPVQSAINGGYLRAATAKLAEFDPVVIGVTGSFGKTSTKFAIEGVIGPPGSALATPGSFNTPLGVCRTINEQLTEAHGFFIVEMGAYGEGEIAELCRFVHPTIGVLTAIGPAHLERFGSLEAIRRAKYEIVTNLPADGVAVMNVDDENVRALADTTTGVRVIRYGLESEGRPEVSAEQVEVTPRGTTFTIVVDSEQLRVQTGLLGRHAMGHVLAAVAVATAGGSALSELEGPIESLKPVAHRLQLIESPGGVTVIDDAYNSNPEGAAAALEVLGSMPARQRIVVTPGMIELGELQVSENARFGRMAAEVADVLIVVAPVNRDAILSGASQAHSGAQVIAVDSLAEATERLKDVIRSGDVVLFENDLPDHYEEAGRPLNN